MQPVGIELKRTVKYLFVCIATLRQRRRTALSELLENGNSSGSGAPYYYAEQCKEEGASLH